jgi:hypothetical protein
MTNKNLYKGEFNYKGQIFVLYKHAYTERQAFELFCRELAKTIGVVINTIRLEFNNSKDNYKITKEV